MKYAVTKRPTFGKARIFFPVSKDGVYIVCLIELEKGTKTAEGALFEMGKSDLEHFEFEVGRWLRERGTDIELLWGD